MCIFDVTNLNANVLFEAGYAVARGKHVRFALDSTVSSATHDWKTLGLLRAFGYSSYQNSQELAARFRDQDPLSQPSPYDALIEPSLISNQVSKSLLYCTTFETFEAALRLDELVNRRLRVGDNLIVSDPRESGVEELAWYAPRILESAGVLVHFAGPARNLASRHNLRHAFIAGMAVGFDVNVLMLAEPDFAIPFDFEGLLTSYHNVEECTTRAREWLDQLNFDDFKFSRRDTGRNPLLGISFGEHVAENERSEIADYFIHTSAFEDVLRARDAIFIGHRGTGKTANALLAYDEIAADKTESCNNDQATRLRVPSAT